jgi:fucokinase
VSRSGDLLILTASNEAQAEAYRVRLAERERLGDLPAGFGWLVVPDPGGRRIGSGGATLRALHAAGPPGKRRIWIVHSGGDSKRLPAFAARGKVFAPLPFLRRSGRPGSVLDLVLADLAGLRAPEGGQVLIASGDTVVGAGAEAIDLSAPEGGLVGIAQRGTPARGSRHGVYVRKASGRVAGFLQKPDLAKARAAGALLADGSVLVDTGIVSLAPGAASRLLRAGRALLDGIRRGSVENIDLYHHLLLAFVGCRDEREYLAQLPAAPARVSAALAALWRGVRGVPFRVHVMEGGSFLHVGTTREYLHTVTRDRAAERRFGFGAAGLAAARRGEAFAIGCADLPAGFARGGGGSVAEGCLGVRSLRLGRDALVSGFGPETRGAVDFAGAAGWGGCVLPVGPRAFATVLFHGDDDGKTPLARGGTFGGRPWHEWLAAHRVGLDEISASGEAVTTWDARLWTVGPRPDAQALAWMRSRRDPAPRSWRAARRFSLAELLEQVSPARSILLEDEIARRSLVRAPAAALAVRDSLPAEAIVEAISTRAEARAAVRDLVSPAPDGFARARRHMVASRIAAAHLAPRGRTLARTLAARSLEAIGEAICLRLPPAATGALPPVRPDQAVWTSAPVRVDLAGGWSDTPPICHERGGTVLNAAILLNGQSPIQVVAKLVNEPTVTVHSIDLGLSRRFTRTADLLDCRDPRDWSALAKAALIQSGVVPSEARVPLGRHLDRLGGGVALSLFSAVPKGSGLGTSSILGAATLACLDRLARRAIDPADLVARTSVLEQRMSTRGGWQDQVGGIYPGLKVGRTAPGLNQLVAVEPIGTPAKTVAELEARTILYFTGVRRMARDILQKVVERYLARERLGGRPVLHLVQELKDGAERMRSALASGDFDSFAEELSGYWKLKCHLDPKSRTAEIDAMVAPIHRYLSAWELPGAGGGGFLFLVARDEKAAATVRRILAARPPNPLARPFRFQLDTAGLRQTVL